MVEWSAGRAFGVLDQKVDDRVAEVVETGRLPVVARAGRIVRVVDLLHLEVRHGAAQVDDGFGQLEQGLQGRHAFVGRTRVHAQDAHEGRAMAGDRKIGQVRHPAQNDQGAYVAGFVPKKGLVGAEHFFGILQGIKDVGEGNLRPDRAQFELEARDNPEVAPAATQPPEEVRVFGLAGANELARGGDKLGGGEVVAAEPVLAPQPAHAAPQGEAGHARRRHQAARCGESEGLRRLVHVGPGGSPATPTRRFSASTSTAFI